MIDRNAAIKFLSDRLPGGLQNKKTLLLTLDSPFLDSAYVFPYLGILYLLAVARSNGLPVTYLEESHSDLRPIDTGGAQVAYTDSFHQQDLARYAHFDVIGISCMTPQGAQAYAICRAIKNAYPDKVIILGGPHARFYLDECLAQGFDLIVTGDGEQIFEELIAGDLSRLAEKVVQQNAGTVVLNDSLSAKQMNRYPIPLREKAYLGRYRYSLEGRPATTLVNSRGCPMSCAFCEHRNTLPRWHSVEHFSEELEDILACGFNAVMIFDDLFAIHPSKLKPYLEVLTHHHNTNGLLFRCFGHADIISKHPQLLELLCKAGCVEIGIGAESASQKILDAIGKKTTVDQLHHCVNLAARHGIKIKAFFMIGLPGETERTFAMTNDFIQLYRRKYPDHFDFDLSVFFPYRGTLIGDALRLKPGQTIGRGNQQWSHRSFNLRLKPDYSWQTVDSGLMGAYKKRSGASDLVIESYDWESETLLLSAEEILELKERAMVYSGRYVDRELVEGNIGQNRIRAGQTPIRNTA